MFLSIVRKIKTFPNPALFTRPCCYSFSQLPETIDDILKSENNRHLQGYYEDILRYAKVSKIGCIKVDPSYLSAMIKRAKNKADMKIVVQAYYNFLGNSAVFPNRMIDNMILKGIELSYTPKLIPIFENHNYLFYYPSSEVLTAMIKSAGIMKKYHIIEALLKIFNKQKLLKPETKTFEAMIPEVLKFRKYKHIITIINLVNFKNLKLSLPAYELALDCLIKYYNPKKKFGLNDRKLNKINNIYDLTAIKSSKALLCMSWLHLLHNDHGSPTFALIFLQDYCKKLNEENAESIIFDDTPLINSYLDCFDKRINAENDPRYFIKFDQFFSEFEAKFTISRIAPKIHVKILEKRAKYQEKAKELNEKLPAILEAKQKKIDEKKMKDEKRAKKREEEKQIEREIRIAEHEIRKKKHLRNKMNKKTSNKMISVVADNAGMRTNKKKFHTKPLNVRKWLKAKKE